MKFEKETKMQTDKEAQEQLHQTAEEFRERLEYLWLLCQAEAWEDA